MDEKFNQLDDSIKPQYKEKKCCYCGGTLIPDTRPPLSIRWKCNNCNHKEYLGPLDMKQMGQAMMNYQNIN